jgi:hypothetical protein
MTPDTTQPFDVLHVLEHSQQLSYNELCSLNLGKISKKSQKFTYSNFPIFFYFLGMLQCNPIHYNIPKSYNNNNNKKILSPLTQQPLSCFFFVQPCHRLREREGRWRQERDSRTHCKVSSAPGGPFATIASSPTRNVCTFAPLHLRHRRSCSLTDWILRSPTWWLLWSVWCGRI